MLISAELKRCRDVLRVYMFLDLLQVRQNDTKFQPYSIFETDFLKWGDGEGGLVGLPLVSSPQKTHPN